MAARAAAAAFAGAHGGDVPAVGNPLGRYPESVTIGVVSGLARTASAGPGRPHYDLLQTDCDIHEGNSGGPLVDMRGRVIGITTLLDSESPYIGLAIPAETVRAIVPQLLGAAEWSAPPWGSRSPGAA